MNTTTLFLHCQHFHEFEISFHETVDKLLLICDNGFIVENETRKEKSVCNLRFCTLCIGIIMFYPNV